MVIDFGHSVADMCPIPAGMPAAGQGLDLAALAANLRPVTLGNPVGGGALVALAYRVIYLRGQGETVRLPAHRERAGSRACPPRRDQPAPSPSAATMRSRIAFLCFSPSRNCVESVCAISVPRSER